MKSTISSEKVIPPRLYRYRSAHTEYFEIELKQVVRSRKVFLNSASTFNDPFELEPFYQEASAAEVNKILRNIYGGKIPTYRQFAERNYGRPLTPTEKKESGSYKGTPSPLQS